MSPLIEETHKTLRNVTLL